MKLYVVVILLGVCNISPARARIFVDGEANQYVLPIQNSSFIIPNTTDITNSNGDRINLMQELNNLNATIQSLLGLVANLSYVPGCTWNGIGCDCHVDKSSFGEISVSVGSNCTNGVLYWTKIISVQSASQFGGDPCTHPDITSVCDIFF